MQRRIELVLLAVLALVLVFVYFRHDSGPGLGGVQAANFQFVPLNVQEPELRLDLLDKIQKSSYAGVRRNVFVYGPAQPANAEHVKTAEEIHDAAMKGPIGPHQTAADVSQSGIVHRAVGRQCCTGGCRSAPTR